MSYHQITSGERYRLSALRMQGLSNPQIAAALGRHRSTIWREIRRNCSVTDGRYKVKRANQRAHARLWRSRSHPRFTSRQLGLVWQRLRRLWSPEQISGRLRLQNRLCISHETIYRYIWEDRRRGGHLHRHLRCAIKQRRKRYGTYERRGTLGGKRMIGERPASVELRRTLGHWEIDTVLGKRSKHCILTLVERKSGYTQIGKLSARNKDQATAGTIRLISRRPELFKTITADNGTEFHGYKDVEERTSVPFYFANPHHSWERGTNENTNGLIRQYLPKKASMAKLTPEQCKAIERSLNSRPRKRHEYRTPNEVVRHPR
jgi:IS30 family transposase